MDTPPPSGAGECPCPPFPEDHGQDSGSCGRGCYLAAQGVRAERTDADAPRPLHSPREKGNEGGIGVGGVRRPPSPPSPKMARILADLQDHKVEVESRLQAAIGGQ